MLNRHPTRRDLLKQTAGVVATGALLPRMSYSSDAQSEIIDAHSHIWTPNVDQFPLRSGVTPGDLQPPSFTDAELLALANPLGVNRVVLIAHTQYYGFDNRYLIDAAARRPDAFRVVGMVDDREPHPDVRMRELQGQHVTGFRITPGIRGDEKWLDNEGMRAMWRCAADTGQAMCCLIDARHLPQVMQMCAEFPRTPVVIDHFARIGVDGTIREEDLQNLCRLAAFRHTNVKVSAFYALGKKAPPYLDLLPMIRRVYECFGADRMMWASDAPYQVVDGHTYDASLSLVLEHLDFMSADERRQLLEHTAKRVYWGS